MKENGEPFLKCATELLEESQAVSQLNGSKDVLGRIFGSVVHKQDWARITTLQSTIVDRILLHRLGNT